MSDPVNPVRPALPPWPVRPVTPAGRERDPGRRKPPEETAENTDGAEDDHKPTIDEYV